MKLLLPLLLLATPNAFAGNVLVVGPLPTQIAEIQAAVDAAIDGDVILVKSGIYATFAVPNKTLTIVADTAQVVNVDGAIRVRNLTADRRVVVSGLRATGRYGTGNVVVGNGFFATNCAGSIRLQDCVLTGYDNSTGMPCQSQPRAGAALEDCADVAFVRCTLIGSSHLPLLSPGPAGTGLSSSGSAVAIHDSTISGGLCGIVCNSTDGAGGGSGVVLHSSFLFASRSSFTGTAGGSVNNGSGFGGDGGHGLVIGDLQSAAHLLECSLAGGLPGVNLGCGFCLICCYGEAGVPCANYGGTFDVMSGTGRRLAANGLARESTSLAVTVSGPPGDIVAVGIRRATGFTWTPARFGVQLLSPPPLRFMLLGTIPPGGVLTTSIALPPVPSTDPGQTYHMQLITSGSTPTPHLGSPLSIAVVDAAY